MQDKEFLSDQLEEIDALSVLPMHERDPYRPQCKRSVEETLFYRG